MQGLTFTLYDMIAYFVPGAIVVWAMAELAKMPVGAQPRTATLPETVFAVAMLTVIYATGHALHAVANLTIDRLSFGGYPPRDYFPDQFEKDFQEPFRSALYEKIVESFKLQNVQSSDKSAAPSDKRERINNTVKNAYWACYISVAQSKSDALAQIFSSINGLYRGLCIGSFVVAVAYLGGALLFRNLALLGVVVVALGCGWLFLTRVARFKGYLTKTVYSDFLSAGKETPSGKK